MVEQYTTLWPWGVPGGIWSYLYGRLGPVESIGPNLRKAEYTPLGPHAAATIEPSGESTAVPDTRGAEEI
jgi:hypothetical protein